MDRDQGVAERPRRDAGLEDFGHAGDVAGRLRHLYATRLEMGAMQPRPHEWPTRRRFALGELILVVRKDEVDPARVDVERRPEVPHRHRRALDVPTRPTRS